MSKWRWTAIAVVAVLLFLAAAPWLPGTSLLYHRWQMVRSYAAAWGPERNNPAQPPPHWITRFIPQFRDDRNDYELFEYHRDQLVRLGAIAEISRKFTHLKNGTPETRHLLRRCIAYDCPPLIELNSPSLPAQTPFEITIWCEWEQVETWRRFWDEHDTVDYRAKFMPEDITPWEN